MKVRFLSRCPAASVATCAILLALDPPRAAAQGCVVGRQSAPVPGVDQVSAQGAGSWQTGLTFRWFRSDRHFIGTVEQPQRALDGTQTINDVALFSLDLAYSFTDRLGLLVSAPYLLAERSEPILDGSSPVVDRNRTAARGLGDVVAGLSFWTRDPALPRQWNVALSLGLKVPTGDDNATATFRSQDSGPSIMTVDQSIQPGDGGLGAVVGVQAIGSWNAWRPYLIGSYLINPRETNGVPTYRPRLSEAFMSVPDAYLARAGSFYTPHALPWLSVGAGARLEGVPVRDLIGGSGGFRRPGMILSAEPSVSVSRGSWSLSTSVPIALFRDRPASVPDQIDGTHGDAAFADYSIIFSVSRAFAPGESMGAHAAPLEETTAAGTSDRLPDRLREMKDLHGEPTSLASRLGQRLTVVNLWATWCQPCRAEVHTLANLRARYAGRGVEVIGVAIDDSPADVLSYLAHEPIDYPVLIGGSEAIRLTGSRIVPTTFFVDGAGRILDIAGGALADAELSARVSRLLSRTETEVQPIPTTHAM